MADQETKFSEEELKSLQDLQTSYQQKQLQFGQLEVQRLLVAQQLEQLDNSKAKLEVEYGEVQETERKLVADLSRTKTHNKLKTTSVLFLKKEHPKVAIGTSRALA